jgi:hypothetical protein
MNIQESHQCNLWNIERVENFLGTKTGELQQYYQELFDDTTFLDGLNERIKNVRENHQFTKGIFSNLNIDSIDWFAFERILLYLSVRYLKPKAVLETGVYYGGNTAFILNGLHKNGSGNLISIDYPDSNIRETKDVERHPDVGDSEFYQKNLQPGFISPGYLLDSWTLHIGDSHQVIPTLDENFDLYLHDSEHSYDFIKKEMTLAMAKMNNTAMAIIDDIDWSNGFFSICDTHKLFPLCLTDNGKDNLRMRTGVIKLDHPKNNSPAICGAVGTS